ncbi:dihydropteroate synthase [Adhaeribacter rhizoryzae]|uniref:Dihydropteroate synthase n=1 Tax=Adhaeribacter rhizoryzae TaxID=2607907 RepID=A0A5M6DPB1_9BACT|nr:dihydropteroate synthase [Adhaeribacter rhizoryzae]KAA5549283.1 dihydropteroate synthase [Adhaeribacter rhizoryzae]
MKAKDTVFYKKSTLNARGKIVSLASPVVMGILNITPDSFYEGSRYNTSAAFMAQAEKMLQEGAAILDIGGYSSRPGAVNISPDEELKRVIPAIKAIRQAFPDCLISIDTFRAKVAEAAINAGADMINDISGGELDPEMFKTVGRLRVPYILMHMRGNPQTMNRLTQYEDIILDLINYFEEKTAALYALGLTDIIIDPGFGFAKTLDQNYEILRRLDDLKIMGLPLLAGLSRKSMTYKMLDIPASEALAGTIALNTIALMHGANILRVHDVKEAVQTIKLFNKSVTH